MSCTDNMFRFQKGPAAVAPLSPLSYLFHRLKVVTSEAYDHEPLQTVTAPMNL